jgi:hypothetical protein
MHPTWLEFARKGSSAEHMENLVKAFDRHPRMYEFTKRVKTLED